MLLVVSLKHVLLLKTPKNVHRLVQDCFNLILAYAFGYFLELVVYKERQKLGRSAVQVEEIFQFRRNRFVKIRVIV